MSPLRGVGDNLRVPTEADSIGGGAIFFFARSLFEQAATEQARPRGHLPSPRQLIAAQVLGPERDGRRFELRCRLSVAVGEPRIPATGPVEPYGLFPRLESVLLLERRETTVDRHLDDQAPGHADMTEALLGLHELHERVDAFTRVVDESDRGLPRVSAHGATVAPALAASK